MTESFPESSSESFSDQQSAERVIPPRPLALRLFVDFNPFYILSAICMLFGVFALNDSFTWSPIPNRNLLTVLGMINVYEVMLIGLALVLLRRSVRRDALVLMLIEAFFLADVGFLNIELSGLSLKLGLTVNALLLLAAVAKALVLFRAARIRLLDGRLAFVLVQLLVLFVVPGVISVIGKRHDTFVHPLVLYAGWWTAGLLPVVYAALVGSADIFRQRSDGRPASGDRILSRVLLVLPMLSIIAHLGLCHWVYKVTFHPSDIAPLLIGLAFAIGRCDTHVTSLGWRMKLQLALPAVAVVLSAISLPREMIVFAFDGRVALSPLRAALLASMLVYLDGLWLHRHVLFGFAAAACGGGLFMGHSVSTINQNSVDMAQRSADALNRLVPRTLYDWGIVSIGAAFVLLALGAMVSFSRRVVPVHADDNEDDLEI
jgi:hypothetical protein